MYLDSDGLAKFLQESKHKPTDGGPRVRFKAEIGFLNEKVPLAFNRKPVYVCFVAERSDGHLIDFRRLSAKSIGDGHDVLLSAELLDPTQGIMCTVACDDLCGTSRHAELTPKLPASLFPPPPAVSLEAPYAPQEVTVKPSYQRLKTNGDFRRASELIDLEEELCDDELDDSDLVAAADAIEFQPLEVFEAATHVIARDSTYQERKLSRKTEEEYEPKRLQNGKWACNHKCKDKTVCKHMCCREGVDKPPKPPKLPTLSGKNQKAEKDSPRVFRGSQLPLKFRAPQPFASSEKPMISDHFDGEEVQVVDLSNTDIEDDLQSLARQNESIKKQSHLKTKISHPAESLFLSSGRLQHDLENAGADGNADWRLTNNEDILGDEEPRSQRIFAHPDAVCSPTQEQMGSISRPTHDPGVFDLEEEMMSIKCLNQSSTEAQCLNEDTSPDTSMGLLHSDRHDRCRASVTVFLD